MSRAHFSPAAREDLFEIWKYIATDNPRAAEAYLEKLLQAADVLTILPGLGKIRPELKGRPHSLAIDSHIIFYELRSRSGIRVLRVLHGSRDVPSLFT